MHKLSKKEQKIAEEWRLEKCGSLDFKDLFKEFRRWRKRKPK